MSASSVIGRTKVMRQADFGSTPLAMRLPAYTKRRVEMLSSRPWPLRLRARCAICTSLPARAVSVEQITADQVGCGHVLVAGDGDERTAELPRHVFDEARFAAAGRALQHHRHARGVGGLVQRDFVGERTVIRLVCDAILFGAAVAHESLSCWANPRRRIR